MVCLVDVVYSVWRVLFGSVSVGFGGLIDDFENEP